MKNFVALLQISFLLLLFGSISQTGHRFSGYGQEPAGNMTANIIGGNTSDTAPQSINATKTGTNPSNLNQLINITEVTFSNYNNQTYGISFDYPVNWTKTELLSDRVSVVQFTSPPEADSDLFLDNINIAIEKLPSKITLNQYVKLNSDILNSTFKDFNITESNDGFLGGVPGQELGFIVKQPLVMKDKVNEIDLQVLQIITVKDNKAYVVTYSAEPSKFMYYSPIIGTMMASVKLI